MNREMGKKLRNARRLGKESCLNDGPRNPYCYRNEFALWGRFVLGWLSARRS